MKIALRISILSILVMALAASCAKEETVRYSQIEQASLDAWMKKYYGNDPSVVRHDNGMYTKVLKAAPAGAAALEDGNWIEILYTGYSMPDFPSNPTGNLFVTRDSTLAAIQGSNLTYRTHYAPHKMIYSYYYSTDLTVAMYETLKLMKQGEKRRVFAPSKLMYGEYGSSYTYGYEGQYTLPDKMPCYMDVELVKVIKDVEKDESNEVWDFANKYMGYTDRADSLKKDFYLKITPNDITADSIPVDSTVNIYYVAMFLDGFVYETNIDSIAQKAFGLPSQSYAAKEYQPSANAPSGGVYGVWNNAFYYAVTNMTYDSWGEMVFSSAYAYGYAGHVPYGTSTTSDETDYGPVFDPYTPLYYKFYIAPEDKDEEEE